MLLIIRDQATETELKQMADIYGDVLIKLAVDIEREILAGGGALHADCEQALLDDGSQQADVWGADWYPELQQVGFESLINIRPQQRNFSMDIQDAALRRKIEAIVRSLLEVT